MQKIIATSRKHGEDYFEYKDTNQVKWIHYDNRYEYLQNADVVIMATDDSKLNEKFAKICKDKKILVNVVNVKKDCGFYFPAIIKQEDVVASVSTGGKSPILAAKIKQDINKKLRKDYGKIASKLGKERQNILKSYDSEAERKKAFKQMVEEKVRNNIIKIGTRGSKLAIIQTDMVIEALKNKHPEYNYEKVILTTKGDRQKDRTITSFGEKVCVNQVGSLMSVFFTDKKVVDYDTALSSDTEKYAEYFRYMLESGINLAPSQFEAMFVSAAHTQKDLEATAKVIENFK